MGQDVSGYGFQVNVVASNTFPDGFIVTQFADDADPFDVPSIKIAESKMGLNGDLIKWSVATPIEISISVVPQSDDDVNLGILLEANRVSAGKAPAKDEISLTGIYPAGQNLTVIGGIITEGMPGTSISSAGRMKSKTYKFTFEARSGAPA